MGAGAVDTEVLKLTTDEWRAINQVMPDDMLAKIHAADNIMWRTQWALGDLMNDCYALVVGSGLQLRKLQVAAYVVSQMGEMTSPYTLVDYGTLAARYSMKVRNDYDRLPYSHFRYAAHVDNIMPALDILKMSLQMADEHGGKAVSLRALREAVEGKIYSPEIDGDAAGTPLPMSGIEMTAFGLTPLEEYKQAIVSLDFALQVMHQCLPDLQRYNNRLAAMVAEYCSRIATEINDIKLDGIAIQ